MKFNSIFSIIVLAILAVMLVTSPAHANRLFGDAWRVDHGILSCAGGGTLSLSGVTVVGGSLSNQIVGGVVSNSAIVGGTENGAAITGGSVSNTTLFIGVGIKIQAVSNNVQIINGNTTNHSYFSSGPN